jgi:hypothetical protein
VVIPAITTSDNGRANATGGIHGSSSTGNTDKMEDQNAHTHSKGCEFTRACVVINDFFVMVPYSPSVKGAIFPTNGEMAVENTTITKIKVKTISDQRPRPGPKFWFTIWQPKKNLKR